MATGAVTRRSAVLGGKTAAFVASLLFALTVRAEPSIETREAATPFDAHLPAWASDMSHGPTGKLVGLLIPVISRWGYSLEYRGQLAVVGRAEDRGPDRDHVYELIADGFAPRLVRVGGALLGPGRLDPQGLGHEAQLVELEVGSVSPARYELDATKVTSVEGTAGYPRDVMHLLDIARARFDAFLRAQRAAIAKTMFEAGRAPTGPRLPEREVVYEGFLPYWDDVHRQLVVVFDRRILRTAEYPMSCSHGTAGTPPVAMTRTITHGHGVELGQELRLDVMGQVVGIHTYDPVAVRIENGPKPLVKPPKARAGGCSYAIVARALEDSRRAAAASSDQSQCTTVAASPLDEIDRNAADCLAGRFEGCEAIYPLEQVENGPLYRCVLGQAAARCKAGVLKACESAITIAPVFGTHTDAQLRGYHRRAADLLSVRCRKGDSDACLDRAGHLEAGSLKDQAEAHRLLETRCAAADANACGRAGASYRYSDPVKAVGLMRRACKTLQPASPEACAQLDEMLQQGLGSFGYEDDATRANNHKTLVALCDAGDGRGCFFGGRSLHDHNLAGAEDLLRKGCFVAAEPDFRACHLLTKLNDADGSARRRLTDLCKPIQGTCDDYVRTH